MLLCMSVTASASTLYTDTADLGDSGKRNDIWSFQQGASGLTQSTTLDLNRYAVSVAATNLDFFTGDVVAQSTNPTLSAELSIVWKAFGADHLTSTPVPTMRSVPRSQ
jgi:hypothetical protein